MSKQTLASRNASDAEHSQLIFDTDDRSTETNGPKMTIEDFTLTKVVGRGNFGKVYLAIKNDTKKFYAVKTLKKIDVA